MSITPSTPEICSDSRPLQKPVFEVFIVFLKLGLTSFGGPIAHLGYFRDELVERRKWLTESDFTQLLALCQFLPGPASSQLGFCLGLVRAGFLGAIAAFSAFTLPSAILLFVFSAVLPFLSGEIGAATIHGLKLVALAVVAHGVLGMGKKLCPDFNRLTIGVVSMAIIVYSGNVWLQLLVVVFGGLAGLILCRRITSMRIVAIELRYRARLGAFLLVMFVVLLFLLPFASEGEFSLFAVSNAFYQSGALVFGGGHVVLPLLEARVVQSAWLTEEQFLAGYGAAQAVPGPMFSFAAYLGASIPGKFGGLLGGIVALVSIFLPGFLLVAGILPFWRNLSKLPMAGSFIAGVNSAVVGLLAAALYDPIWTSSVSTVSDLLIASIGFLMLLRWKLPSILVVLWCLFSSVALAMFT
jgi:chromate transporter